MGATEQRALDRLAELGAEVKVSYETRTTRLHAKAWLFRRAHGLPTAYVGSSNLSKAALVDGLEWNVRLSHVERPHVVDTFTATFDEYWNDPAFEPTTRTARTTGSGSARRSHGRAGPRPGDLPIDITSSTSARIRTSRRSWSELDAERRSTAGGATWS